MQNAISLFAAIRPQHFKEVNYNYSLKLIASFCLKSLKPQPLCKPRFLAHVYPIVLFNSINEFC